MDAEERKAGLQPASELQDNPPSDMSSCTLGPSVRTQNCLCSVLQVLILSEGHQLYFGPPEQVTDWFSGCLGYSFWPGQHGSVADWLMDLVSVRFSKPAMLGGTTMASRADVVTASELWHAHHQKVLTRQLIPWAVSQAAVFCTLQRFLSPHASCVC